MIKVAIVDDQKLMVDGLKTILDLEDDIEVVAVGGNGEDAIKISREMAVDVILMDVRMPMLNGIDATKAIKTENSKVKILILTTFDEDKFIVEGLAAGADGYMLKDIEGDDLIFAVREMHNGNYMLQGTVAKKLAQSVLNGNIKSKVKNLTEREVEVAKLLGKGFTNKQIAENLFLSEGTIKNCVSTIYSKIEIFDRAAAALYLNENLS